MARKDLKPALKNQKDALNRIIEDLFKHFKGIPMVKTTDIAFLAIKNVLKTFLVKNMDGLVECKWRFTIKARGRQDICIIAELSSDPKDVNDPLILMQKNKTEKDLCPSPHIGCRSNIKGIPNIYRYISHSWLITTLNHFRGDECPKTDDREIKTEVILLDKRYTLIVSCEFRQICSLTNN